MFRLGPSAEGNEKYINQVKVTCEKIKYHEIFRKINTALHLILFFPLLIYTSIYEVFYLFIFVLEGETFCSLRRSSQMNPAVWPHLSL